ncbi:hypothetical protein LCGC14_2411620, partial [marine sediment metagenome]
MTLTEKLKSWLISNKNIEEDAGNDEFKKAASDALVSGDLSTAKFAELCTDERDREAQEFTEKFDRLADNLEKAVTAMTAKETDNDEETESKDTETEEKEKDAETKSTTPKENKQVQPISKMARMVGELGGIPIETDDGEKSFDIRVKEAVESYDSTKSALTYPESTKEGRIHAMAGQPVMEFGLPMQSASNKDIALAGVFAKFQIFEATPKLAGNASRAWERLSEHEKSLLVHLTENEYWDDSQNEKPRKRKGYPGGIKALIDDSTSGGLEAAPIVFDDQVIQTPLLHGELYPLVSVKPIDRGRRIEGVATGTVTGSWGGVDDTAITLFSTASYVSAFDTTIFRWEGAIRIGLDFLSDTPIDFGAHITAQYGERLMEDLDDVIAAGNGTTQPEGVITKSGTTSVAFGGNTSIGNYESLRFGVAKPEHGPNVKASAVFCGNETSYQRARALNVGTNDARRLFGFSYDSYSIMERPYKIVGEDTLGNTEIFYAILARYRMYRRRGLTIRTSTE